MGVEGNIFHNVEIQSTETERHFTGSGKSFCIRPQVITVSSDSSIPGAGLSLARKGPPQYSPLL